MKPPRYVRIAGQRYTVSVVPPETPIIVNGHDGYVGAHQRVGLSILVKAVNANFALHQQAETFLHESLHGIMDNAGLENYLNDGAEEKFVDAFTPQLLQFLRANPQVVAYLTSKDIP